MIYTLGESLMDVIFEDKLKISAKAGGAMLNLAVSLGRCNLQVCLMSELGDDKVAQQIISFLEENNVNTDYIQNYKQQVSSLALAFLDENKKPSYSFYKAYPENRKLKQPPIFSNNDILIFGSLYSLDGKIRSQLKEITETAKSKGTTIIYDPNIRHAHHLENGETMKSLKENLALADIIKGSDEDFENIFGKFEEEFVIKEIRKLNTDATIVFTKGELGARIITRDYSISEKAKEIKLKSTVGAGDNFTAGMVYAISNISNKNKHPKQFSELELQKLLRMGIEFSSEVCQSIDNYISNEFANSL